MALIFPALVFGQEPSGIKFEKDLSWDQVKTKAKEENKYIFVDFFASWCGPCKQMDRDVYPLPDVGNVMNANYISVKCQLDTPNSDGTHAIDTYPDIREIGEQYRVREFPTFIFFSPNGDIVHRAEGFMAAAVFDSLAISVLDPGKQFYTLLRQYYAGHEEKEAMYYIAMNAGEFGVQDEGKKVALTYKRNFLDQVDKSELFSKKNLELISRYPELVENSTDPYFNMFYRHPEWADSIFHRPGYSKSFVKSIIRKEYIYPNLFDENSKPVVKDPDWTKIERTVKLQYGEAYAVELVNNATRINFYSESKQWRKYAALIGELIQKYSPKLNGNEFANATMMGNFFQRDDWNLNTAAWNVFQHCDDKKVLKEAVKWSDLSLLIDPDSKKNGGSDEYLDTKANLLYKIGRIKKAIKTEEEAYKIARASQQTGADIMANLNKMRTREKTW